MNKSVYLYELDSVRNSKEEIQYAQERMFREIILNGNQVILTMNQLADSRAFLAAIENESTFEPFFELCQKGVIRISQYGMLRTPSQYFQGKIEEFLKKAEKGESQQSAFIYSGVPGKWMKMMGLVEKSGDGKGVLTTSIILGMMILPTIIGTTESAMRAVPEQYYEGALALGATHERSIFTVIIPAAKSGVIAGIVLGIGRAIGETMAVIMIVGNQPRLVSNMLLGMRTLTGNIVIEMGYATGLHREALIATGVVLFVFILIINFSVALLKRRGEHE